MLICEAAGYDVVLVETIGTGQSETMVADMTDFFLVLMLPGAGDELQGLKKGVVEIADMIAINKADGDNFRRAKAAAADYRAALHILNPRSPHWSPPVVTYSALTGDGASSRSNGCGRCLKTASSRACDPIPRSRPSSLGSRPPSPRGECRQRSQSTRSRRHWASRSMIDRYASARRGTVSQLPLRPPTRMIWHR
jgi:putative protein kinase ArgK-like GTPase of G3E family